jgi:hypothetical protein
MEGSLSRRKTAQVAKNMWGDQEYQQRAQRALPILVRQAISGKSIYYQQLADELGMSNPRTLNFPLGSVGQTLIELGRKWDVDIPPIQCLVVNQAHSTPGPGFGWFLPDPEEWAQMSPAQRRRMSEQVMQQIYAYPRWLDVLEDLNLRSAQTDFDDLLKGASNMLGGGESEAHKLLKEYIRSRPSAVGIAVRRTIGRIEEALPSGDRVDVFFDAGKEWIAVEVKSRLSDENDLTRGLYQCVKYTAVLRGVVAARQLDLDVRSLLAIEGQLTYRLRVLATVLGVQVIESIRVPQKPPEEWNAAG